MLGLVFQTPTLIIELLEVSSGGHFDTADVGFK
jgi:hypothetical protein